MTETWDNVVSKLEMHKPAFPVVLSNSENTTYSLGMSTRDYLASAAMQALIGTATYNCLDGLYGHEATTAAAAYRMADAMLKERGDDETC